MENEIIEESAVIGTEENPIVTDETNSRSETEKMQERLLDAESRLALLLAGIAKENLEEAAAMAAGLCSAGKSVEEAAKEIAEGYPHLKALSRSIPRFAAASSGSADGFAAIRKIFSGR